MNLKCEAFSNVSEKCSKIMTQKYSKIIDTVYNAIKLLFGKEGNHNPAVVDYVTDEHTVIRTSCLDFTDWYNLAKCLAEQLLDAQEELKAHKENGMLEALAIAKAIVNEQELLAQRFTTVSTIGASTNPPKNFTAIPGYENTIAQILANGN